MSSENPKSPVRFGWNSDGTPNSVQQAVIKEIVDRTEQGQSARTIADDLNSRHIRTGRPGKWYPSRVRAVVEGHRVGLRS
jgi:hypothetical protein